MSQANIEKRLVVLEAQVASLAAKVNGEPAKPWWHRVAGVMTDDATFDEAMRLGREYRESLRPGAKKKGGAKKNGHSRHRSSKSAHSK